MKRRIASGIILEFLVASMLTSAFVFQQVAVVDLPPTEWSRPYGGTEDECAYSVVQTSDAGYALAGYSYSCGQGSADFWLVKTLADGSEDWSSFYGGSDGEYGRCVIQTSDGGYAIAGWTDPGVTGDPDFWLVKAFPNGVVDWSRHYDGSGADYVRRLVQTSDGGYALAGRTDSSGAGKFDFWLVKVSGASSPSPDFSITAYPASMAVPRGSSDSSVITVTSLGNFSQQVQLSAGAVPSSGVSASLSTQQVMPSAGGAATATLTINTSASAAAGYHAVTVTAANGTLNHWATVVLIVLQSSRPWDLSGTTKWAPDQKCDIRDLALVARFYAASVGDGRYDGRADLTGLTYLVPDGKIDNRDTALMADHFGETYS